ncbi:MAG: beta-CASP ribonuclease aCPSF1 [Candidatus Nezhaarchaeales archaeon]
MNLQDPIAAIRDGILSCISKDAKVSKIEFEGPEIAIYVQNSSVITDNGDLVRSIARLIRKRIVLKSDPEIRKPEDEAKKIISQLIPRDAGLINVVFDKALGEVIIEVKKPGLVVGKDGALLRRILAETLWRPSVVRTPPVQSRIVTQVSSFIYRNSDYRYKVLKEVGRRINRPQLLRTNRVRVISLGGFLEVGRSAIMVEADGSRILLDCGVKLGSMNLSSELPELDTPEFNINELDAVVVTHAHLDHCGAVPFLFKYGYRGPVYCSKPTRMLMALLLLDYMDVAAREGREAPYDLNDVKTMLLHTIPLNYGEVTDIAPNVKLTLHNAGHILGSTMVHLHIGEGLHNIVYTGDFKFAKTKLLEASSYVFPRLETLIMESTYGAPSDVMPSREETEQNLINTVNTTLQRGGKVLIPVLSVGRAQEIMLVLAEAIDQKLIPSVPVYVEGMIQEATAIHTAYPEDLCRELKNKIFYEDQNPFLSENFITVKGRSARPEIVEGEPCVILATSGMLNAGPAIEYFKLLAENEKNCLIFVSYQVENTLGRRVQRGVKEVSIPGPNGKEELVKVNLEVKSIEGFSGHSDRRQLLRFIERVTPKPKRVIICHGEPSKSQNLAFTINKYFRIPVAVPSTLESIRLV